MTRWPLRTVLVPAVVVASGCTPVNESFLGYVCRVLLVVVFVAVRDVLVALIALIVSALTLPPVAPTQVGVLCATLRIVSPLTTSRGVTVLSLVLSASAVVPPLIALIEGLRDEFGRPIRRSALPVRLVLVSAAVVSLVGTSVTSLLAGV